MSDDTRLPAGDEELLGELRALMQHVDPVPPPVTEAAKAVLGWSRLDADLAELLADSALDAGALAGVRGDLRVRTISFASADLEVDVEIHRDGGRLRLVGQLAPPLDATIAVQAGDGSTAATAESDALGRFRVELGDVSIARLRVIRHGTGAALVETSWLTL